MNSFVSRNLQSPGFSLSSVILAAAMILTQGLASANNGETQNLLNGKGIVLMEIKNKPLCEVMREIQARSGAEVKVPQILSADLISRSVRGDTWQAALSQLLEGYNYSAVWGKNGQPLQLSVYARNQYADEPVAATATPAGNDLLVYDGNDQQENGNFTWVGYLENAGKAYRVIISMGSEGNHGQVVTPNGVYSLDVEEGRIWLVDAGPAVLETENPISQGI